MKLPENTVSLDRLTILSAIKSMSVPGILPRLERLSNPELICDYAGGSVLCGARDQILYGHQQSLLEAIAGKVVSTPLNDSTIEDLDKLTTYLGALIQLKEHELIPNKGALGYLIKDAIVAGVYDNTGEYIPIDIILLTQVATCWDSSVEILRDIFMPAESLTTFDGVGVVPYLSCSYIRGIDPSKVEPLTMDQLIENESLYVHVNGSISSLKVRFPSLPGEGE